MEIGGACDIDDRTGGLERADRGFGKGRADAQDKDDAEHDRQPAALGQPVADHLGEGHEAELESFHEEHQAQDHRQQAREDGNLVAERLAQDDELEQREVDRQRHHGAALRPEADLHIGAEQAVDIDTAQVHPARTIGLRRAIGIRAARTRQFIEADAPLTERCLALEIAESQLRHAQAPQRAASPPTPSWQPTLTTKRDGGRDSGGGAAPGAEMANPAPPTATGRTFALGGSREGRQAQGHQLPEGSGRLSAPTGAGRPGRRSCTNVVPFRDAPCDRSHWTAGFRQGS